MKFEILLLGLPSGKFIKCNDFEGLCVAIVCLNHGYWGLQEITRDKKDKFGRRLPVFFDKDPEIIWKWFRNQFHPKQKTMQEYVAHIAESRKRELKSVVKKITRILEP